MNKVSRLKFIIAAIVCGLSLVASVGGQDGASSAGRPKPVTVPVTIRLRDSKPSGNAHCSIICCVKNGDMQTDSVSQRTSQESPLTLAILFQDDLVSSVSVEARAIAEFIRHQPGGTRVMIGYIHQGSLEVRRKFTNDLERVAQGVRPPLSLASASPFNPFVEIIKEDCAVSIPSRSGGAQ